MSRNLLFDCWLPCIFLGILALFPLLALAIPTKSQHTAQPAAIIEERNGPQACGFSGDDNTYGLGIRLGVYFQWITSSLAYNFVPEEAVTMRGVNNCFQASMFAGLLFITITKGSNLYAVEAFIMLIFCVGGVCSGDNPPKDIGGMSYPKRFAYHDTSSPGSIFRVLLAVAFCAYGVWFTFHGMDNMQHPSCSTFAFFFARVNLYNWFRTFLKFSFAIGAISFAMSIFIVVLLPFKCFSCLKKEAANPSGNSSSFRSSTSTIGAPPPSESTIHTASNAGPSGALIMFIVAVELIIRWNHISGVNSLGSTGQLLPLIIGVGGMYRVVYRLISDFFKPKPTT